MKSKIGWLIVSCVLILSLVLASCGTKTTPTTTIATSSTTVTTTKLTTSTTTVASKTPTTKPSSEIPQQGGVFTYRVTSDVASFDAYFHGGGSSSSMQSLWLETLAMRDWGLDRKIDNFKVVFSPLDHWTGRLADSWEISSDGKTYTFHIRKGVYWQDKSPLNGRELTAYDIEWSINRCIAKGSGFTKGSPYIGQANYELIQSITATDKYTLVFNCIQPSFVQFRWIIEDNDYLFIEPKEAVDKWGDLNDWHNVIGTGPFILDDYVSASSLSLSKNQKYWGYDERNPDQKLPYSDTVKVLIIPDLATSIAALRTGKIDLIENIGWEQAESLARTNPELKQVTRPDRGLSIAMMVDKEPFNDIQVRRAMQKSIDLDTIAKSFYNGLVDGKPMGLMGLEGYYTPYDEWPQEIKDNYAYDPTVAKKLLTDAGYPAGFKCTITASTADDLDLLQVLKSYLAVIGVDMQIQTMDPTAYAAFTRASKHEMLLRNYCNWVWDPSGGINRYYSGHTDNVFHHVKDALYDDLWKQAKASAEEKDFAQIVKEIDMRTITQQWVVNILPRVTLCVYQPWLKQFNGEAFGYATGQVIARFWIDQTLKKGTNL